MAPRINDFWVWIGLGVFTGIAIKGVAYSLREIINLTEVRTPPPRPAIPPNTVIRGEDAIKTSSLEILALCNNVEIRKASTHILCERFMTDPDACLRLRKDLRSRNPERARRAKLAFRLLFESGVLKESGPDFSEIHNTSELPLPRRSRNSTEERDLRRRRREAIIVNEGDRPISHEDVWMRDDMGLMNPEHGRINVARISAVVFEDEEEMGDDDEDEDEQPFEPRLAEYSDVSTIQEEEADRLQREEAPSPPSPPLLSNA